MLDDFEENLINNEHNLPRSINVILKNFENPDVIQLETEFEMSTTSKEEASIKSVKSFDFEHFGSNNRLRIISHNKLFNRSSEMESCNVKTCVPEFIELSPARVGLMAAGMEITERGSPDQVHTGSEVIKDQNFRKRDRNASDQFSSPPTLRRSARLLQKAADSVILMRNVSVGPLMEVPSLISAQGILPVLRLRGGGPRKVIRRPTIQRSSRPTNSERTVPSPLFWTPIHPILMGPDHRGAIGTPAWSHEAGYDSFSWERLQYPFGDWLRLPDLELLTGEMPRHFPGSIHFNQMLRQLNRDIGLPHLEGSLLGYPNQEDRRATRNVTLYGRNVRESSLLDQAVFYSELG